MKKYLIALLIWLFPAVCLAAPSITGVSGTFTNDQTITISGSGFGTNSGISTSTWLGGPTGNIESGTDEAPFSASGWSALTTSWVPTRYDSAEKWSGSNSIRFSRINGFGAAGETDDIPIPWRYGSGTTYDSWYISFYAKVANPSVGTWGQWKIFRLSGASNVVDAAGTLVGSIYASTRYLSNMCLSSDPSSTTCYAVDDTDKAQIPDASYDKAAWQKIELWYKENSASGAEDGCIYLAKTNASGSITIGTNRTDWETRAAGISTKKSYFWLQNWLGSNILDGDAWIDDVHVQRGSRAHAIIAKGSTFTSRGLNEDLIPVTWAAGAITATFNAGGAFSTGQPFYVYVINDDGTYNAAGDGPYTVGDLGEGDTTPATISSPLPTGVQTCTTDPRNVTLQVTTNENATVKYSTTDQAYDSMANTFSTTGELSHSTVVSNACGGSYTYYCRSMDGAGNKNTSSTPISYSVEAAVPEEDTTLPTVTITSPADDPHEDTTQYVTVSGTSSAHGVKTISTIAASGPTFQTVGSVTGTTSWSVPVVISQGTFSSDLLYGGGAFTATGSWSVGTGWTIDSGVASHSGTATNCWLGMTFASEIGKTYQIAYTVSGSPSGTLVLSQWGFGGVTQTLDSSAGTHTVNVVATRANSDLAFVANPWVGTLDNVTVKKVQYDTLTITATDNLGYANTDTIQMGYTSPETVTPHKVVGLSATSKIDLGGGKILEF